MKRFSTFLTIILLALFLVGFVPQTITRAADPPAVHAVLFYSPSCGHCQKVITQDLPPLMEKYQDQLNIVGIDVTTSGGQALYQSAINQFKITSDRIGVPTLIVGDVIMVGSEEIPDHFPALIEQGLAAGGIPMPEIWGLAEALSEDPSTNAQTAEAKDLSLAERFALDPVANSIAVVVLIGMLISVVWIALNFSKPLKAGTNRWPSWAFVVLLLIGLFAAGYLTYVEVTDTAAVCGPIGNCNVVQQSPYARLFGVLPVGILGLAGYLGILLAWLLVHYGKPDLKRTGGLILWGFAWFGTLFSIYLTFLEPFVIGATCAWCLTSAIVMTLLLWASTPIAQTHLLRRSKTYRRSHPPASTAES